MGVGTYLVALFKTGSEAAVKTRVEEGIKSALREMEWPAELARELQKARGVERQELRYKSYGGLWKELRALAIYDSSEINHAVVSDMHRKLSDWYFSESGGLMLTPQSRNFYFGLQDLLRLASAAPSGWRAVRTAALEGEVAKTFLQLLEKPGANGAIRAVEYFRKGEFQDWEAQAPRLGEEWRADIKKLGQSWLEFNDTERFAVLQQVGSKLRTSLVNDLESRLR
jgi:hypothetical protein